jgi:hypothetical protein
MIFKVFKYISYSLAGILVAWLLVLLTPPLFRRMVKYPAFQIGVEEFQKLRKEPSVNSDLRLFRGVMHVHSYWSHDSEGRLNDIIPAARENGIDFIFLADHPHGNLDTLPRGYNGYYDDVLIVPGTEKQGFDAWPFDSVIIDWRRRKDSIASEVISNGGIICFAHPEEEHDWGSKWYQGMEIYNFHADTKDEKLLLQVVNFIINGKKYPQWSLREMFDEQTSILSRWDSLNCHRKIFGFSAVDTHENQNIRARYLSDGRVQWVGPNAHILDTARVNIWNRWLFHPPDKRGWIFRFMIDTYKESFRYITNYVYADTLSVKSLSHHIKMGHLYTAFMSLGDAGGFQFLATGQDGEVRGIMGDSVRREKIMYLQSLTPLPGQFRLIHNGIPIYRTSFNNYEFKWDKMIEKGTYRVEVYVRIRNRDLPWIYSNPIYVY